MAILLNSTSFDSFLRTFPLKFLHISNSYSQKIKPHLSTSIAFPHLTFLNLLHAHVNYAEQFLLTKNAYVPRLMNLRIRYKSLAAITNNFTNEVTQFNFTTLKRLDTCDSSVQPETMCLYFPLL